MRRIIADADKKMFDVIIAWREGRLYRGMRPMLDVIECIEKNKIEVELVKEVFDSRMAPVKAWAARMELEAKNDRLLMGMSNGLEKGLAWSNPPPYGYKRVNGKTIVNEEEAQWVRQVFEWYASGINMFEIRRRLINSGVKQRHENVRRPWHLFNLRRLLKKKYYYTSKQTVKWNDQRFEIDILPIIDQATAKS
jgi:site-specific DNA recombinase